MNTKLIKMLGIIATGMTLAAALLKEWTDEQELQEKIDNAVERALAERNNEEEES